MVVYFNLMTYGCLVGYSLLKNRPNRYEPKTLFIILGPLLVLLGTALVLTYNWLITDNGNCVFFGSHISFLAVDIENQCFFVIASVFVYSMHSVMRRISARNTQEANRRGEAINRQMIYFVVAFVLYSSGMLAFKYIIYSDGSSDDKLTTIQIVFCVLQFLHIGFNAWILALMTRQVRLYL